MDKINMDNSTLESVGHTKKSHIKDLALLFGLPLLVIGIAVAILYIPTFLAHPKYDFLYTGCGAYSCSNTIFTDSTGKLKDVSLKPGEFGGLLDSARIYYYDSSTDSSKILSLEEANRYVLDTSSRSPDGYILSRENSSGGFLFFGSDYSETWVLKNGLKEKEVNISGGAPYYSGNVKLLGWVKQ